MTGLAPRLLMLGTLALLTACGPEAKQPALVGSPTEPATSTTAPSSTATTPAPASKAPGDAPHALIVSVGKANVREKPDTKARIIQVLTKGTKVAVVGKGHQWYRVRVSDGTEGWVAESVVAPAD